MPEERKVELKKLYYLDHFNEMLGFVEAHNRDLLDQSHFGFIERFRSLELEDQCLFVRLANRKGKVFRHDQVVYEEISDLESSIFRLKEANLFRGPDTGDFDDYVACLPRKVLLTLVRSLPVEMPRSGSAKKSDLVNFVLRESSLATICRSPHSPKAVVLDSIELEYLLFIYFGRLEEGLGAFALRDLGIMKTREGKKKFRARFENRETALAAFHFRRIRREIRKADREGLNDFAESVREWPIVDDPEVNSSRDKTIYSLGRALERQNVPEAALSVYQQSGRFPSSERAVRLQYQLGKRGEAKLKLRELIENPSCDEELIFAEDFYERKFGERRVGRLTEVLRGARVLALDESGREYPEAAVISWLERSGAKAFHVENLIWSQLFGVVFHDALFDQAAIHSDFDRLPAGLNSETFFVKNEAFIEKQISQLKDSGWITSRIETASRSLEVNPNYLICPDPDLFCLLERLVEQAPKGALEFVLMEMVRNFRGNRSGFPDLIVFEGDEVRFIEVKTEGDHIQRHQLAQLERLRRAGFDVELARVQWSVDPGQVYVVVDVETTGGNPSWNRVTEIGAVKVKGGEVIDEWSSLINPGRRIPRNIVQLTGITDEMVSTAPLFSEIADELREFMGDAVFVGHRVKFDFGFIKEEFKRIDQNFRAATFCTVVETRRHFPGLKSYGLANLCGEFDIPLNSHHRALCDAKATAEILFKINAKRQQGNAGALP